MNGMEDTLLGHRTGGEGRQTEMKALSKQQRGPRGRGRSQEEVEAERADVTEAWFAVHRSCFPSGHLVSGQVISYKGIRV